MTCWRGPDGIRVEAIVLNDRPCLRVTKTVNGRRYHLDYCRDIAAVARHVDLSDLVEVIPFPGASTSRRLP